jgi:hypothetical protein
VLEDEEHLSVLLAGFVQRREVRVRERGRRARVLEQAARRDSSLASAEGTRLMATVRPTRVSRARKTSPSAPAPMRSSNW